MMWPRRTRQPRAWHHPVGRAPRRTPIGLGGPVRGAGLAGMVLVRLASLVSLAGMVLVRLASLVSLVNPIGLVSLVSLVSLIGLGSGCGGRDRDNPFDPVNPDTHGEPGGLRVVAGCRQAELAWDSYHLQDIAGFRLWRESDGLAEELLTPEPLPPDAARYRDEGLRNQTRYVYRVEFLFAGGGRASLVPRAVEPGSAIPWIGDPCGWGLVRLSPDGRDLIDRVHLGGAIMDLEVDGEAHRLYAAQIDQDRILVCDSRTGGLLETYTVPGATGLDWNAQLGLLVVCSYHEQQVAWLRPVGGEMSTVSTLGHPEAAALRDSTLTWVAFENGSVQKYDLVSGAAVDTHAGLEEATALADDPEGGGCWVADRGGQVVYITAGGSLLRTAEGLLERPLDLRATGTGTCWVADYGQGMLIELDRTCQEIARHSNLGRVAEVAYDPITGDLWSTVPDEGEVLRINARGEVSRIALAGCPRRLDGDWAGGCQP